MSTASLGVVLGQLPAERRLSRLAALSAVLAVACFPVVTMLLLEMLVGAAGVRWRGGDRPFFLIACAVDAGVLAVSVAALARTRRRPALGSAMNVGLAGFAVAASATWVAMPALYWGLDQLSRVF